MSYKIKQLDKLPPGSTAVIKGFSSRVSPSYLAQLLAMGLTPGIPFTVIRRAPLGDPIQIKVRGSLISLRQAEANILMIESLDQ